MTILSEFSANMRDLTGHVVFVFRPFTSLLFRPLSAVYYLILAPSILFKLMLTRISVVGVLTFIY
jgi:hypothetical protein